MIILRTQFTFDSFGKKSHKQGSSMRKGIRELKEQKIKLNGEIVFFFRETASIF